MAKTVKVLSTLELMDANHDAVKQQRNRALTDEFVKQLDAVGIHMVAFAMPHNANEVRTKLLCKVNKSMDPVEVWLDFDADRYNSLRDHEVPEVPI